MTIASEDTVRSSAQAAFARLREEIATVPDAELIALNFDLHDAVHTVIGVLPELTRIRPLVVDTLPRQDLSAYDRLEEYAKAAQHANTLHQAASRPPEPITHLVPPLRSARELLLMNARILARYGGVDETRLRALAGGAGHQHLAADVHLLVTLLRASWDEHGGRVPATRDDLDQAERLAERLAHAVAARRYGRAVVIEAARTRHRAFTLLYRAYDEVRRIVSFVRWHEGDAEAFAPSFYRGRVRAKPEVEPEGDGAEGEPEGAAS